MSGWRSHLRAHGGVRVCAMSLGVGQTRPGAFAGCRQPEPLVPQRPLSNATGAREGWGPSTPEGPLGAMLSSDTTDTRGNVSSRPGPEMQTRRDVCPLTGRAARRPGSAIHARRSTLVGGRRRARRPSDSSGLAGRSAREAGLHLTAQGPPRGGGGSLLYSNPLILFVGKAPRGNIRKNARPGVRVDVQPPGPRRQTSVLRASPSAGPAGPAPSD